MSEQDDIQDLAPVPPGDGVEDDTFSDLNETLPPKSDPQDEDAERRSHRNDPMRRIGKLTKRLHERDAQLAAERQAREEAEARLRELENSRSEQSASELEAKLQDIRARRDQAFQEGDIGAYHDLCDEYDDTRDELRTIKRKPPKEPPKEVKPDPQPQYPQKAVEWASRNTAWYDGKPDNPKVVRANEVFREVLAEGFDPETDEFYEELDDRLKSSQGKPVTSGPRAGDGRPPQRPAAFTEKDKAQMKAWGLDHRNPKHRQAWADRNAELG